MPVYARETVKVSKPVKRRLDDMAAGMVNALGRDVSLCQVIEELLAEHDRNITQEAGA